MHYVRMFVLFGTMLFIGCGPTITEGDVYYKEIDPEHTIEVDDSYPLQVGDVTIIIPASHTETVPDRFYIDFRKRDEKSGEWLTRRVEVDRTTYDRLQEGDFFSSE